LAKALAAAVMMALHLAHSEVASLTQRLFRYSLQRWNSLAIATIAQTYIISTLTMVCVRHFTSFLPAFIGFMVF